MRLTCPNCGAQYEVPDEVIPESGRDVQCSNCGDTWFQPHPAHPETAKEAQGTAQEDWAETPEGAPEVEQEQEQEAALPEEHPQEPHAEPDARQPRELAPEIAEVLREEARREEQARATEARGGLETQPDLGLAPGEGEAERRARQAKARMERLRGAEVEETEVEFDIAVAIGPASRRNLLPDIEETSSAIGEEAAPEPRDASARDGSSTAAAAPARAGGFRRGFRLAVALALIAVLLYVFAPRIGDAVPALAPPLEKYVEAVNHGRVVFNDRVAALVAQVQAMIGR